MFHSDIIRAWKDEEYRLSLSDAERALLPDHPAGLIDLGDADLDMAGGGRRNTEKAMSLGCCHGITTDTCNVWQTCSTTCYATVCHGTCGAFSVGCC